MLRRSAALRKRLVMGMWVEDSAANFDTEENRKRLRRAHERHNLGILHHITLAQKHYNRLPLSKRCFVDCFVRRKQRGVLTATYKEEPDDFVAIESVCETVRCACLTLNSKQQHQQLQEGRGGKRQSRRRKK